MDILVDPKHEHLGTRISVPIPKGVKEFDVKFDYSTSNEATAIQWAAPEATAGKKHPYVYTQCQAIHARSLLPCMDSPGVKATYSASVHAPEWCTVLMSAVKKGGSKHAKDTVTMYVIYVI